MKRITLLCILFTLFACGDDDTPTDDASVDDATTSLPTMPEQNVDTSGLSCAANVPTMGFGTAVGDGVTSFRLLECDGSEYDFYNEEFCAAKFTIVAFGAGWCQPCIEESRKLKAEVDDVYTPQGVRLIQTLIAKQDFAPADQAFCSSWVTRFGLTNTELIDPWQLTSAFYPAGDLPATYIIDDKGQIVFREIGATDGITSLTSKLDELLQ